ncbi:SDR family NAD(P)-dependent oxidoreductase [Kribbella solani]|uniref:NAD(P)-dependent dehydrogenase (Short-subunit alcohol dehydrogenase family) n=1 Tax=Kribbella solani TaxID=236067 RepID=A0A841E443_9ACTN|nr:SDR family oxidoreductase [Kribbella solani]MBB5983765.1 NAD(P)-dependent dehydrogenase (short-subunit alcohol dehydrogenase family) [Kribbella solani]
MNDQVALVTGASRGIGRAIAERLAAAGAEIAVHYNRDQAGAEETLARIGGRGFVLGAELGVPGDADEVLRQLQTGLAGRPLGVLVNNAAAPPNGPIDADTEAGFDRLMAVNVRAPYFLIQRLLPVLADGARIVSLSSVATRMANPGQTSFAMTKGAVETMTRTLAQELGRRGITVNAVAPGATRTEANGAVFEAPGLTELIVGQTALGRLGSGEDVAEVVAFLASPGARWITGQVVDASGGLHLGVG